MSAKMWEVTIDHARTCVLDPGLLSYCPPGSQQKTGVVFNIVGQVMGLLSDGQYAPIDKLSETEKASFSSLFSSFISFLKFLLGISSSFTTFSALFIQAEANNLVIAAFKRWTDVVPIEDEASLLDGSPRLFNNDLYSAVAETSGRSKSLTCQKIDNFEYPQPSTCSPDIFPSIYSIGGLDDFGLHTLDNMDFRFDQPLNFSSQVVNPLISETDSITQAFREHDNLQYFDSLQPSSSSLGSPSDLHSAVNSFLSARSTAYAQRRWKMLFSVLRWISIKRLVAKRTLDRENQRHP